MTIPKYIKLQLVSLVVLLLFTNCKEAKETHYHANHITFTCPKGWTVTDEENYDNEGFYMSIEKEGFSSSGIVTVTWLDVDVDLDEFIDMTIEELKATPIYKNVNFNFRPITDGVFNTNTARQCHYTFKMLGLAHQGDIYTFYSQDKTFLILKQGATEDHNKNATGFKTIEESFKIL